MNKRLFLKPLDKNIFTNKYLNKTLYLSNNSPKTIKTNKNENLNKYKNKKINFGINSILKNINNNYIEKNILQKNNLVSTSQQTKISVFNNKFNKNNNNINRKIDNKYMNKNFSFFNNVNLLDIINSNDININLRKISRNNSVIGIKNNQNKEKFKFNDHLQYLRINKKKLFNSHLFNVEQNQKRIQLKKLRVKNNFKTIHYQPMTLKHLSHLNSNKKNESISDDSIHIIFSKKKLNRDRNEPKFFHKVNDKTNIKSYRKFELNKKMILFD